MSVSSQYQGFPENSGWMSPAFHTGRRRWDVEMEGLVSFNTQVTSTSIETYYYDRLNSRLNFWSGKCQLIIWVNLRRYQIGVWPSDSAWTALYSQSLSLRQTRLLQLLLSLQEKIRSLWQQDSLYHHMLCPKGENAKSFLQVFGQARSLTQSCIRACLNNLNVTWGTAS